MFSAFKKLTSKTDLPGQNGTTSASPQAAGVQSMSHNLQKKFAKVGTVRFFALNGIADRNRFDADPDPVPEPQSARKIKQGQNIYIFK